MGIKLLIDNGKHMLAPEVMDGVSVEWARTGLPGRLTFTAIADKKLVINEGNVVKLWVNKKPFFKGYIFTRNQTDPDTVSITCYDQLRYLKNQESYIFENITADGIVHKIADDFKLSYGKLADTGYKFKSFTQDNVPLFDIIAEALEKTNTEQGKKYVLYDDFGKLTLEDGANMDLNLLVDESTAQSYSYSSSIDGETYNKVKIVKEGRASGGGRVNEETEKKQRIRNRSVYIAQDENNMKRWGVLQLLEEINKDDNGQKTANKKLKKHNAPEKTLGINGAFGDSRVRAGCRIGVVLKSTVDKATRKLIKLRVENVKHTFSGELHTMDLILKGKGFDA